MAKFSARLRELRKERKLRQKDLANALSVAQTTIANYEQGSRFPDESTLDRIADYFETSLDYLLGRLDVNVDSRDIGVIGGKNPSQGSEEDDFSLSPLAKQYTDYLINGNRGGAVDLIMKEARSGQNISDIYLNVFEPALKEIGRLWSLKQVSVAQEHFASAVTEQVMSQIFPLLIRGRTNKLTAVTMTVCGDLHEIGIRFITDFLEMDGWNTYYLGTNLCNQDLIDALDQYNPDLLSVSVTMDFNVNMAQHLIDNIRANSTHRVLKVMVGGHPFQQDPGLWKKIGADATSRDAREAVVTAARLFQ